MKRTYTPNQDPPPSSNGGVAGLTRRGGASVGNGHINSVRSPYESSGSDHSENSSQGTFQEHGFEFHPPRLSDIPEYPEGGLDSVGLGSRLGGGMGLGLPRIPMLEPHINDDESEMSEVYMHKVVDSFSPAHFLLSSIIGELSKPTCRLIFRLPIL